MTTLATGQIVADRYRIGDLLGEGGMGAVYKAEHVHMRKTFALKVLHAEMCSMPEVLARFEREAVAAGNIEHPNVAQATDFGRLADGSFFLVLEYVAGRSLREEVKKGPIQVERAIGIMRGIVSGVAAAHAKGIVHRDLKPENVMLVERDGDPDFPKVLDFGIAKLEPDAPASAAGEPVLTRMGTLIGTPDYMSPEQALGQAVDARTDIYSLGVIFHEMLAGKPPFVGEAVEVIQQHLLKTRPPLPNVDPAINALLDKAMAKAAPERIQTADELLAAIEKLPRGTKKKGFDRRLLLLGIVPIALAAAFFAIRPKHDDDVDPAPSPVPVEPAASIEDLTMPDIEAWEPPTPSASGAPGAATAVATSKPKSTTKATASPPPKKTKRKWYSYF